MTTIFLTHDPDSLRNYYGEVALARLRELAQVRINDSGECLATDAFLTQCAGCELVIADSNTPVDATFFDHATDLVALLRCAVDTRTIDIEAASRNGILVTNADPGFVHSVTELIFGLVIDLARHITYAASTYHAGRVPEKRMGVELHGTTMGIIGYGNIGVKVAEVARVFGMSVIVCDPYKAVNEPDVQQVGFDTVLKESDFLVCLANANADTENLIDAASFAQMKPSACFINASRGNLVDENALTQALHENLIAGAALDVGRAPGQLPTPQLAAQTNVIATPHIGGLTPPASQAQALGTVAQVRALLSKTLPDNALNTACAHRLAQLDIIR